MFNLESKVFIKSVVSNNKKGVKGIVKEQENNKYKVTFFKDNQRVTEWFEEKDLTLWKAPRKCDEIYFAKVKPNAIIPSKRKEDGGYDIFACFDEDMLVLHPHKPTLVPTGIASAFSNKYRLNLKNERGSVGSKGLSVHCGLIDSGFRNEIFVCIINLNNKPVAISKEVNEFTETEDYMLYPSAKAIAQAKLEIVPNVIVKEIPYEELLKIESERGLNMLGSTNKKE